MLFTQITEVYSSVSEPCVTDFPCSYAEQYYLL